MKRTYLILLIFSSLTSKAGADSTIIQKHFDSILNTDKARSYENTDALNQVASYIFSCFDEYGDSTVYQRFEVQNKEYCNVITSFGPMNAPRIIVGAHYDVCGDQDGADDNASGIAGLLEIARLLAGEKLNCRIDLVAYSLEEPPFFGTDDMGSYKHAEYLYDKNIEVIGMICMDMIGFFSDEKGSQNYPLGMLKMFYGSKGDYITVVRKFSGGKFARKTKRIMKSQNTVKVKSINAPGSLRGIDLSDHLNYWRFGFSAVFITDTGFFRNYNYHKPSDTIATIDFKRMAGTIDALIETLINLGNQKY